MAYFREGTQGNCKQLQRASTHMHTHTHSALLYAPGRRKLHGRLTSNSLRGTQVSVTKRAQFFNNVTSLDSVASWRTDASISARYA